MTELETMKRAKMYLEKLANGIDPLTDNAIQDDSVINNIRISRCLFYTCGVLQKIIENNGKVITDNLQPFSITPEQALQIEITEDPVGISDFTKRIKAVIPENMKCIPVTHITEWLVKKGYLQENIIANKKRKVVTALGKQIGIHTIDGTSRAGTPYQKNIYTSEAQRFVVSNLHIIESELSEVNSDSGY